MSDDTLAAYMAAHPKMTGVLFALLLILSQAGMVAGQGGTVMGP